jgi:hypothetical protein
MQWFDDVPCAALEVKSSTSELLELVGPGTTQKVAGGLTVAFGATFAATGLRFLRLPIRPP